MSNLVEQHPDTWRDRDYPVLHAVAGKIDQSTTGALFVVDRIEGLDMPEQDVSAALHALDDGGYLSMQWHGGGSAWVLGITDKARRAVGMWPSAESVADAIIAHLDKRIAETTDPEERNRWERFRDAAIGGGRVLLVEVAGSVLGKVITGG